MERDKDTAQCQLMTRPMRGLNLARHRQKYPVSDSARTEIICLPGPGIENNFVTVSGWMI